MPVTLWECFAAAKRIKRHMKDHNYGLAANELEVMGMMLDQELMPGIGTEWDYEAIR